MKHIAGQQETENMTIDERMDRLTGIVASLHQYATSPVVFAVRLRRISLSVPDRDSR